MAIVAIANEAVDAIYYEDESHFPPEAWQDWTTAREGNRLSNKAYCFMISPSEKTDLLFMWLREISMPKGTLPRLFAKQNRLRAIREKKEELFEWYLFYHRRCGRRCRQRFGPACC